MCFCNGEGSLLPPKWKDGLNSYNSEYTDFLVYFFESGCYIKI